MLAPGVKVFTFLKVISSFKDFFGLIALIAFFISVRAETVGAILCGFDEAYTVIYLRGYSANVTNLTGADVELNKSIGNTSSENP